MNQYMAGPYPGLTSGYPNSSDFPNSQSSIHVKADMMSEQSHEPDGLLSQQIVLSQMSRSRYCGLPCTWMHFKRTIITGILECRQPCHSWAGTFTRTRFACLVGPYAKQQGANLACKTLKIAYPPKLVTRACVCKHRLSVEGKRGGQALCARGISSQPSCTAGYGRRLLLLQRDPASCKICDFEAGAPYATSALEIHSV